MGYASAAKQYKKNQIETASPKQLVILLYEGAIKYIRLGELALEQNDYSKVNKNLQKAQDIVTELMVSLNHQDGQNAIASDLEAMYSFILNQLLQANLQKDQEKMVQSRRLMSELLEAWTSI
ncbi:flagellar protein FliS [Alkalibacterium putridalgicola]|uniref:Flagellar protein FliS n=1 Tax=Alkalibacterium putridalgicola TaxID=426703 RepID=A0A1H7RE30_9LACT|nr:flagellar export chaperone FliS [Alkalibacterium putridalgicola]GEK88791.1 flagellar protein FliS [Alkalibacterium putridalgicola]SEL58570.1 flagellar protein FliS [Alkalibacterium putridalgicola]